MSCNATPLTFEEFGKGGGPPRSYYLIRKVISQINVRN